jgi:hypothetical protein
MRAHIHFYKGGFAKLFIKIVWLHLSTIAMKGGKIKLI